MDTDPGKKTPIEACHCMALRRAARRISQAYDEALAPAGLRATQFSVLALVGAGEGLAVNALAARLDLDRTTTGKNLAPLERDGLITVTVAASDRRSRNIVLTQDGRARLDQALPLWKAAQRRLEEANGKRRTRELREQVAALRTQIGEP